MGQYGAAGCRRHTFKKRQSYILEITELFSASLSLTDTAVFKVAGDLRTMMSELSICSSDASISQTYSAGLGPVLKLDPVSLPRRGSHQDPSKAPM